MAWHVVPDAFQEDTGPSFTFLRVIRGQIPSLCTPRDALEAKRISVVVTTSPPRHRPVGLAEI
jgi:hypothetical protein